MTHFPERHLRLLVPLASTRSRRATAVALLLAAALVPAGPAAAASGDCDPDDGGLALAEGWCAAVFASELGAVRNVAVAPDGSVYAARRDAGRPAGIALRDGDGDGRADESEAFGPAGPAHGVLADAGRVWLATDRRVLRFARGEGALAPGGEATEVVVDLPRQSSHARKAIALGPSPDGDGEALFVNVGAPSNACQEEARTPRSPGLDPCPQPACATCWPWRCTPTPAASSAP